MPYVLQPLTGAHDRSEFCCGRSSFMDEFCRGTALDEHDRFVTRIKVALEEGSTKVVGFHAMCAAEIKERKLTYLFGGSGGPQVPAVRLEKFAADVQHQGGAVSDALMRDVFETALDVADRIGACFLYLDAANDKLVDYYLGFEFIRVSDKGLGMYIPIDTMRDALNPAVQAA